MYIFKDNFKVLASVYMCEILYPCLWIHYINYININNGTFGLDFNLLIIYNFDFIITYGDFSNNKGSSCMLVILVAMGFDCFFYVFIIIYVIEYLLKFIKVIKYEHGFA